MRNGERGARNRGLTEQEMLVADFTFRIPHFPPTTSINGHKESATNIGCTEESSDDNPRRLCQKNRHTDTGCAR
jgi:hypothetical protein